MFLSGAGLPPWIWDGVRAALDEPGEVATYSKGRASLREIAEGVVMGLPEGRCHLVAHSIGGTVAAGVAVLAPERIAAVTAVCAIVPRPGRSFASSLPAPQRYVMGAMVRLLGTRPPASVLRNQLCGGLDEATADRVVGGFEAESRRLYLDRLPVRPPPSWPHDTAYLVTTDDAEFPAAWQKEYAGVLAATTTSVASGHLPMLTHPDVVARVVARVDSDR